MAEHPNPHISYPEYAGESLASSSAGPQPRQLLKDRLYIGNLHPTVDEYTVLQVFSKYGKVAKLDFLFHKAGPMRGKPRGYAFLEYNTQDEAVQAVSSAHDKLLRGRKLVVTFAHQAPAEAVSIYKPRKTMTDAGKPTTLSMIKTGIGGRNERTNDKIALMEAKLREMETASSSSTLASTSRLPRRPAPSMDSSDRSGGSGPDRMSRPSQTSLPAFPIASPSSLDVKSPPAVGASAARAVPSKRGVKLLGVKIVKTKDKT